MSDHAAINDKAQNIKESATNLLAIDTATDILSVALSLRDETWYFEADAGTRHSQLLMGAIDHLMNNAGLEPKDLQAVCCMAGPGSFTGLRIGFACAKGLSLSLDIPFFTVPTLDCMASRFSAWPGLVLPAIDAKKSSWFCALYMGGKRLCPDMDATASSIAQTINGSNTDMHDSLNWPTLITGHDAERLYHVLVETPGLSQKLSLDSGCRGGYAKELAAISSRAIAKKIKMGDNNPINFSLGPDYIRKSDAELELEKRQENV